MLEKLSKHQDLWLKMLINLGAELDEARDLVQDMYLKVYDHPDNYNIGYGENDVNKYYVYHILRSLFIDKIRKSKRNITVSLDFQIEDYDVDYDYERDEALNKLTDEIRDHIANWIPYDKKLLELYFGFHTNKKNKTIQETKSQRGLSREIGLGLSSIHNSIKNIKEDLSNKFGEDIEDYFNGDFTKI